MAAPMPRAVKGWSAKSLLRADMNACAAAQDARTALALVGSVLDQGLHLDPHLVTVAFNLIADRLEAGVAPRVPAAEAARRAVGVLLAKSRDRSPGTFSDALEAAAADPRLIEEAPARFVVRTLREHGVPAAGDANAMVALLPVPAPMAALPDAAAAAAAAAATREAAAAALPEAGVEGARAVYHRCSANTGTTAWEGVVSMFVRVCARSGRPMEGWRALTDARRAGLKPKLRAFSSLLETLAPAQAADVCTKLRCEIKGCGLVCGQHEYALLVQALGPASMRDAEAVARITRAGEAEAAGIRPVALRAPSPAAPAQAPPAQDTAAAAAVTPVPAPAPAVLPAAAPGAATPLSVHSPASSVSARSSRADPPPPLDSATRPAEHRWSSAPVLALLAELMDDVYAPEEELQSQLRRLFESGPMRRRRWRVGRAAVGANGVCPLNGGRLRSLDLSDEEMTQLARQTVELATRTPHRQRSFEAFQRYLLQHGPWDVLIDGANVGFFNQNYAGGMFSHPQIDDVVRHFEEEGRRPLLILHERWFGDSVDLREHRRGGYKRRRKETSRSGKRPRQAFAAGPGGGSAAQLQPAAAAGGSASSSSAPSSTANGGGEPAEAAAAAGSKASVSSEEDDAEDVEDEDEDELLSDSDDPEAGAYASMRRCLSRWNAKPNLVFQVPRGNNDDWYWLYAAVTRGGSRPLVMGSLVASCRLVRSPSGSAAPAAQTASASASVVALRLTDAPSADKRSPASRQASSTPSQPKTEDGARAASGRSSLERSGSGNCSPTLQRSGTTATHLSDAVFAVARSATAGLSSPLPADGAAMLPPGSAPPRAASAMSGCTAASSAAVVSAAAPSVPHSPPRSVSQASGGVAPSSSSSSAAAAAVTAGAAVASAAAQGLASSSAPPRHGSAARPGFAPSLPAGLPAPMASSASSEVGPTAPPSTRVLAGSTTALAPSPRDGGEPSSPLPRFRSTGVTAPVGGVGVVAPAAARSRPPSSALPHSARLAFAGKGVASPFRTPDTARPQGGGTPQPTSAALSTAAVQADSDTDEPAAYMSDVSARDATSLMRPPPAVRRTPAGPVAGMPSSSASSAAAAGAPAAAVAAGGQSGGPLTAGTAAGIDLTGLPAARGRSASGSSAKGTGAAASGPFVAPRALRPGSAGDRPASASPAAATAPGSPPAPEQRPALALAVRRRRSDSFSRSSRMSAGSASPMSFASSEMERMPVGPGAAGSSTHASKHGRVFVISNDQMRDHHFQMLAPQNFLKWRERHQVAFHFQDVGRGGSGGGPQRQLHFRFPSIFSHRTQPAVEGRAWYFPVGGTAGQWLCCWKEA